MVVRGLWPTMAGDEGQEQKVTRSRGLPRRGSGMDRRSFVKGMMAGAAVGAIGVGAAATGGWIRGTYTAPEDATVHYSGAKVLVGSPAPRGLPFIPLAVEPDGTIRGRSDDLRPYRHCGRDKAWSGVQEDYSGDDHLRYTVSPHKLAIIQDEESRRERWWYFDRLGERLNVAHFRDQPEGTGAQFTWREENTAEPRFEGTLVKLPLASIEAQGEDLERLRDAMLIEHDLVAFDAACTHFCCHAAWHEDPTADRLGFWDTIFCTCHAARFDPRQIESYSFEIDPTPDAR